ncbi:hypothetical protein [Paenibacillus sp. J2TS4]|nr:hypothetical protein [Paenibacillus sp. J2TS4]GIP32096.1 hypothetical protein J2TS4_13060 [Paenibacillus sp. J2TS4]
MIIATYNIWNDERTLSGRLAALCEEIGSVYADVIAFTYSLDVIPTM